MKNDEVSSKHCFEVVDFSNHTHGKPTLTWFEEIFEEYYLIDELLAV
ncbi:chlorohydrolase [Streptococcus pneumoniae]|nr:chlorohydrolase [Streptococcus pneumoniae]